VHKDFANMGIVSAALLSKVTLSETEENFQRMNSTDWRSIGPHIATLVLVPSAIAKVSLPKYEEIKLVEAVHQNKLDKLLCCSEDPVERAKKHHKKFTEPRATIIHRYEDCQESAQTDTFLLSSGKAVNS
jgi:hypothetical protein